MRYRKGGDPGTAPGPHGVHTTSARRPRHRPGSAWRPHGTALGPYDIHGVRTAVSTAVSTASATPTSSKGSAWHRPGSARRPHCIRTAVARHPRHRTGSVRQPQHCPGHPQAYRNTARYRVRGQKNATQKRPTLYEVFVSGLCSCQRNAKNKAPDSTQRSVWRAHNRHNPP
jgi:hypothetical protein